MTTPFSTFGSPIGYPPTWGTTPYAGQGTGISPWQQQFSQQPFQAVPQQLQQLHHLHLQELQLLQHVQQLLQIVPQQLQQLQQIIQIVPQQLQQLQQQLQSQQSPFGQTAAGMGGGAFGSPFLSTPMFGPQSFPSHVM